MDKQSNFIVPFKFADASDNPLITEMSFVFVDSEPNGNLQGIKPEDFGLIIDSGSLMPIKMVEGKVEGHASAKPLGVIKYLEEADGRVIGHGLFWNEERPSDIALIKEWHADAEKQVDISFEVRYTEGEIDNNGVEWLRNPSVKAVTIVANPAYKGRTPILAIAEYKSDSNLPDESFAYISDEPRKRYFPYRNAEGTISKELLQQSQAEVKDIDFIGKDEVLQTLHSAELDLLKEEFRVMDKTVELLTAEASTLRDNITDLEAQVTALTTERDGLQAWKDEKEKSEAEAALLNERLGVLAEAGFEYDEDAVKTKRSFILGLEEEAFATYVSDIKSIKDDNDAEASLKDKTIPNLSSSISKDNKDALLSYMKAKEDKKE